MRNEHPLVDHLLMRHRVFLNLMFIGLLITVVTMLPFASTAKAESVDRDSRTSSAGDRSEYLFDPHIFVSGKIAPGQLGLPGEKISWEIQVTNNGTISGNHVIVTDAVIPELRIDGAKTDSGKFTTDGQSIAFELNSLTPGETATMHVFTTVVTPIDETVAEKDSVANALSHQTNGGQAYSNRACVTGAGFSMRCMNALVDAPVTPVNTTIVNYAPGTPPDSRIILIIAIVLLSSVAFSGLLIQRQLQYRS